MDQVSVDAEEGGRSRSRRGLLVWIPVGVVLYVGFVVLCFTMEAEGRARFRVPSKADISAIEDRADRIRAEGTRQRALEAMREWGPYAAYTTGAGVVVLGGSALATLLGAVGVWRGVRRDSVRKAKVIVIAVLLVFMGSLLLLAWPGIVAEKRLDAKRTPHVSGAGSE